MPVFSILALIAYLLSLGLIIPSLVRKSNAYRRLALVSAVVALFCHGIALKHQIFDVGDGQNLTLLNIGSIVGLMICSIMTFVASRGRGWFLLPIVYSFAMINLALASLMPGEFITHLEGSPALFIHIGLALLGYATLIIAALYALQLAWLDYLLKNKKLTFTADMPPLMSIERKMFHITQIGVVLLTLTLCTGLLYMDNLFSKENIHKAVLSIMAWFVYIILLWGHYHEGWRGRRVVWFSFAGAFLLTLAYFGSRLLQEVMVH
ncbi:inner membrane protein YpjD [Yersinia ruckeri]|uniref:CcsA-related protein n=1 Tax=Yersinia ruckeri TaxID=29486 RepID=A0A085U3Z5_YERRU|nr:inner membrane protein YpjD [Yersinia ruckeri]AKA39389.1 membrane protein [Yersinia ruckeri]ARZ02095.1 Inner membrane protein YpjD [Yersinia ruckeri]AUQ40801.1 inner membrane protein YpjD [Yersinia ruckeri]EKN3347744.1 inner membrane protein YpjD [Yersinia ruckeri]EKN3363028.1 inner membrane protein YpjD [Yersinia ruckeri]